MSRSVTVDLSQAKNFGVLLKDLPKKALSHAMRDAVNRTAFQARTDYVSQARMSLTMRNTFTERSIQVEFARGNDIGKMQARVGSTVPWMERREDGSTEQSKGKHGVVIPVPAAAGQANGGVRTKPVRRGNYMGAITLSKAKPRNATGGRKQVNAVAMRLAAAKGGNKVAFLDGPQGEGMFRVTRRGRTKFTVRMLYDMSHRSVTTKPMPMIETVVQMAEKTYPVHCEKALVEQLRRAKLAGR